ncbi:MAG: rod shape-determining protein RodA [Clostridia bacterium]|nr:rod shape-determining protein RodA [Clostridia bacterium]
MENKTKKKKKQGRFQELLTKVKRNRLGRGLMIHFEWPLVLIVLALSLFGVLSIYAATATPVEDGSSYSFLEMMQIQPFNYPRLQLIWMMAGAVALLAVIFFDYQFFGDLKNLLYWGNVALLLAVKLLSTAGRGGMNGWFQWGDGRTFQPSELGKIAIIIALAKLFADREKPITRIGELFRVACYVGLPLALVVIQPDVGTALVYMAIFAGLLFASGTDKKIIIGIICIAILLLVPAWYLLETSDSFRVDRIQVWLDPTYDPNGAGMQTTNARIALGSGGLWGKGLFADGNFAALNYIPDDHTDFIFAIVGETFGLVGATAMVLLFLSMLVRMIMLSMRAQDAFGSYIIVGVISMMLFHIFENIGMVIGLMPVTGIPLPFISYGGSNYLTNIIGVGLVVNVAMRSRAGQAHTPRRKKRPVQL